MKKSFKSLISILTVAMMLVAMVPTAMAVPAQIPGATISVFNAGEQSTAVLTDNWYYTHYQAQNDLGGNATATAVTSNLNRVVAFNAVDSGIMWSWEAPVSVKRIDLWIHTEGGIKDYEIQTSADGLTWNNTVKSGAFAPHCDENFGWSTYDRGMTLACYYPIVLDSAVETKYIRFVIKSFIDETNTAYISEAKIYDTNMINFGELGVINPLTKYSTHSPYLWGFSSSGNGTSGIAYQNTSAYSNSTNAGNILPMYTTGNGTVLDIFPDINGSKAPFTLSNEGIWYTTSFYRSQVKINKVGLSLTTGSTVTGFEVWATTTGLQGVVWKGDIPMPDTTKNGWVKVADIDCYLTADNDADDGILFDLPEAIEANGYMIYVPYGKYSPVEEITEDGTAYVNRGAGISRFHFYSVDDSDFTPGVQGAKITGTVAAGETLTLNFGTNNFTNANAKIYFAVFSGDELVAASSVDCPVAGTTGYEKSYTIPADAGDNLTLKAFVWDGTTLVPLLTNPVVAGE